MRSSTFAITVVALVLLCGTSHAVVLFTDPNAFSGSETLLTFAGLTPSTRVTSHGGVSFAMDFDAGGIGVYTDGTSREFGPGETTALRNWFPGAPNSPFSDMTMTFATSINRLGFELRTNPPDDLALTVKLMSSGQIVDSFMIDTIGANLFYFYGFETAAAFDEVDFDVTNNANGAFSMDNLRYENVIPEPTSLTLLGLGLLGAAAGLGKRTSRNKKRGC